MLVAFWLTFCQSVHGDQTIFQPTIFGTGSSLTINSGITVNFLSGSTVDFNAGSSVDFTGATVTGLAAGGGTVTSFSSGDLSPLFTTTETNPTTTPALAFVLSTAAANTVFGNNTGSTAAPAFQSLVNAQIPATLSSKTFDDTNSYTAKDGSFTLENTGTTTKKAVFTLANITAGQTRTVNIPDVAQSSTIQPDTGAANNFLTAISSQGFISKAQPAFTNLSGSVAATQMPALTGDVTTTAGAVATTYNNAVPTAKGGAPSAGTAGQVLTKNTATNYDYGWKTFASAQVLSGANPPAINGATAKMCGFGTATYGPFLITPTVSGKVLVAISFWFLNDTASGSAVAAIRYGTGTAPVNGATQTGTGGSSIVKAGTGYTASQGTAVTLTYVVTGLTINTQYWFDLAINAGAAGQNVAANGGMFTAVELP